MIDIDSRFFYSISRPMCSTMLVKVLRERPRQSLFVSQLFPNFIPASSQTFPSKCAIFDIETKAGISNETLMSILYHNIAYFLTFFSEGPNRVAKCHGYGGYIRVKIFRGWGKKSERTHNVTKLGLF